jgi:hypothetical protein
MVVVAAKHDVIVRQKRGNPTTVYLPGTPLAPISSSFAVATMRSRKPLRLPRVITFRRE